MCIRDRNNTGGMTIRSGTGNGGYIRFADGTSGNQAYRGTIAYAHDGDFMQFSVDSEERLRIVPGIGITVTGEVAASQDYPNYRPTLDFNFAAEKKLDPRITYFRSGPASYVNEFGKVVLVGDNAPRFDYDPTTRESKGLLIEVSRTNQLIFSSDITDNGSQNSGYSITNGTVTGDQTTAPDGTTTADQFAANSTNSLHRVSIYFTSGQISNSTAYTFSVFAKANGYDKLHIRYGGYNADNHGLGYDLSDGTTFAGKFDGTGSLSAVTSSSMIAYPNGWYRCSFTFTTASDAATGSAGIFYYISNSEATTNFAGDGSSGMYFWGAQMEVGTQVSSFIPTNGSTATRGGDFVKVEDEEFSEFYNNATEHTTVMIGKRALNVGGADGRLYTISNGTSSQVAPDWDFNDGTHLRLSTNVGGSSQMVQTLNPWNDIDSEFKIAAGMAVNNQIGVVNGVKLASADTSCSMPTGVDRLYFGLRGDEGNQGSLTIKRFMFYPKRLPDSQLVTLTS